MKMSRDHQGRAVGGAFGQPEFQGRGQKCLSVHITCAFDKQKYGKINKRKVQKIEKSGQYPEKFGKKIEKNPKKLKKKNRNSPDKLKMYGKIRKINNI